MTIIMISRGTFSGGKDVAESLASRLGYPCISREMIIHEAAEYFGIPENELNTTMVEPPRFWQQAPNQRIAHMNMIRTSLIHHFKSGNLVYHGYAAHLLLGNDLIILRVRINSDMEYRIQAAMYRKKIDRDQAIKLIDKLDKQSTKWAQVLYGIEWRDPSLYDVILNLQALSIESIVEILFQMTLLKDFKPDQSTLQVVNDLTLGSKVWATLNKTKQTSSANVHVEAAEGHITISGSAKSEAELIAISNIAESVEGVTGITNNVGIGSSWIW